MAHSRIWKRAAPARAAYSCKPTMSARRKSRYSMRYSCMLARWVGSRHLPPRRGGLWRRLGRSVAGRQGGHVTMLESRTTERQARHTSMQARPATESYWVLTSYHAPITTADHGTRVHRTAAAKVYFLFIFLVRRREENDPLRRGRQNESDAEDGKHSSN